ncbi:MAG TPA: threonine--tRNA ligase [Candidatus Paceibacterota bacterium]
MATKENLEHLRHSLAHLLAAAVLELYPDAKNTLGPAIETGFYYDFEFKKPISDDDLLKIEKKMSEILPGWQNFTHEEMSTKDAKKRFKGNPYKLELIDEIEEKKEKITLYTSGEFTDLCRGGHADIADMKSSAWKLSRTAGAYWRGSEKNKMLTRIYGLAFEAKEELDAYEKQMEEAKKRDHRKIGKELGLFVFSDLVGSGLPLFTPKGTRLRDEISNFTEKLRLDRGFQKVWIPHLTKTDLYKTSGHWDKFGHELLLVKSQETGEDFVIKPMNCPHHQQIYASDQRSYRDLPIRYLETTTVYRDEKTGELSGLSRVRSITQDDSHIFCTPEQIEDEYQSIIEMVKIFFDAMGMKFRARLSFRDAKNPKKYLGEESLWERAQEILLKIAKKNNLDYFVAEGEAAFYGPKIDFMAMDAIGREHQLATPQLDFVQPARFGLEYTDTDGSKKTPVMIHLAIAGSLERFLSLYIEHTAGSFPLWLSPVQVKVLPIGEDEIPYAKDFEKLLKENNIRAETDDSNESLGKKIRNAKTEKIPYLAVIGKKETESGTVTLESRTGSLGALQKEKVIVKLMDEIKLRK